jgi:hypothetical protein
VLDLDLFLGLVLFLMYVLCLVVICRWWFCRFDLLLVCLRLCCCCCSLIFFFFGFIVVVLANSFCEESGFLKCP